MKSIDLRHVKIQNLSSFFHLRSLSMESAELFDNTLQGLPCLENLELSSCVFDYFKSESFRHVSNIEFLHLKNPYVDTFFRINFGELKRLKWLKLSIFPDYSFFETLSLNKDLHTLIISDYQLKECEFLKNFKHNNLKSLELEFGNIDNFDGKWLSGLPNLRNLALSNSNRYSDQVDSVPLTIDLSSLNRLESIYFENLEFQSLDFILAGLTNLKW